jgi:23S rRNA (guanosine2251-2'-O)-methyltransferase
MVQKNFVSKKNCIIYGKHSSLEALKNIKRKIISINVLSTISDEILREIKKISRLGEIKINKFEKIKFEMLLKSRLDLKNSHNLSSQDKINHQGIFIEAERLSESNIFEFLENNESKEKSKIIILDHVLDTSNIGSIIRICASLGADLLILTKDHCPDFQTPAIMKIASGAGEHLEVCIVTNLASTIDLLKKNGYWVYGFSLGHSQKKSIFNVKFSQKSALILGSEEKGLRKLTNQKIDLAVYIPISNKVESLNVSSALSIGLFELTRQHG